MVIPSFPVLALWATLAQAAPAQPQARIVIDHTSLTVGQSIDLAIIVENAEPAGIPDLPVDQGLHVAFRGQSRSVSMVGRRVEKTSQLRYDLSALREGTWHIGPAGVVAVDAQGQTVHLSAPAVQVQVTPAADPSKTRVDLRVDAGFNHADVWQGEVVIWRQVIHSRLPIASFQWHNVPTNGLLAPRYGKADETRTSTVDPHGTIHSFEQLMPWLATTSGHHVYEVPAVELEIIVPDSGPRGMFGFFNRTRREVRTVDRPILDVKPLPPAPVDFSGLVGDFKARSIISTHTPRVGENFPWTVIITGDGAIDSLKLPELHVDGLRVYDDAPTHAATMRDGSYQTQIRFDRNIVPLREGELTLPSIPITIFSPTQARYVTLEVEGATFQVKPGEHIDPNVISFGTAAPEATALSADDTMRPLRRSTAGNILPWARWMPLAWLLTALPTALYLLYCLGRQTRLWLSQRRKASPSTSPTRRARDQLIAASQPSTALLYEALQEALMAFSITHACAFDHDDSPLSHEAQTHVRQALAATDRVHFAGQERTATLPEHVRKAVTLLEGR